MGEKEVVGVPGRMGGGRGWRSEGGQGKRAGRGGAVWRFLAAVVPLAIEAWVEWRARPRKTRNGEK
ncbi:MAG: hypothetical protein H5U00_07060 [Clostridia bacterium]|nr:hypothetical protein [Clostridia bacterium]